MANKRIWLKLTTLSVLLVMLLSMLLTSCATVGKSVSPFGEGSAIRLFTEAINTGRDKYFDSSAVKKLPDTVKDDDIISVIIRTDEVSLMDIYDADKTELSFTEYVYSEEAKEFKAGIDNKKEEILTDFDELGISYFTGSDYSVILSGFEINITAKDFDKVCDTLGDRAEAIVGDVYQKCETQLVENEVNFYEDTGIFDSSDFGYDGTGLVIAVLDTGLDYYHSAFSVNNFTADPAKWGLTFDEVAALVGDTVASELQSGLTASDVYVSQKVPFAFDYADGDSEVYPIQSDHGTHVSGVIAGKDDTITGVAPNAQLVEMKIFSDVETSARTSWILNALEDCVVLDVDVINMSIGTACGFSRETDKEAISGVYDKIRDSGISLVVAASNSFNSTYGSEKNGNLGLTSNPDSATVGSPSTYAGALSVASINGVKTPYLLYKGTIVYFTESTDRFAEEKHFVDELLGEGRDSVEIEYVTIPGAGRKADYTGINIKGKIALVRRGTTTFEEKATVAQQMGAAGLIIYNNVAGEIKMNVGNSTLPVCSVRQDDGEMLAEVASGKIKISRSQTSGPFMSDFSSWGPTPDLGIKPEITAHGGNILSAVPGQGYERQSGTSMASPNMAGVVALLRQYLIESDPTLAEDKVALAARVNQLMMSTADIIFNTNGLPYSVRKQGAGLANLNSSAATTAYIQTYDKLMNAMDKTKIELGDDPSKSGVYTMTFSVVNFGSVDLSYDLGTYVMTEGVSDTLTTEGKTTVTEQGYILSGATTNVTALEGGTMDGKRLTVKAGDTATLTVTITLSDADKKYLDKSFANGMYVEGFIVLTAANGTKVSLNVPYLAFYGDWTKAPILDLDYFATNKDELDDSIDLLDKTLPDAYATRPIGGLSSDYVSYLGSFYFQQDPSSTNKIAADRKYISLSNQTDAINSLRFVWAGMLRNADYITITIVEDATGEVIFETTDHDIRKAYGDGGPIYPANVDVEFSAIEHNLKNNTAYTVTMKAYLDYGDGGEANNLNNTFVFPLVADFSAPAVTDCEFYTEYDKTAKETRYFAKIAVYDNHYAMGMQVGYVGLSDDGTEYMLHAFDSYMVPIYSNFNDTTYVVYELTDYINQIKKNAIIPGHEKTITVACYDYALNQATYEIALPDEFEDVWFREEKIVLSPNEVYTVDLATNPSTEWGVLLDMSVTRPGGKEIVRVVNNKILAVQSGTCLVRFMDPVTGVPKSISVTVLAPGDEGYRTISKPVVDDFRLTGYRTDKAFYYLSSDEREIGMTGDEIKFNGDYYSLSMFPSEAVTLRYVFDPYFPSTTNVVFESSDESKVTVDQNGKIIAVSEGYASVSVRVYMDGKQTYYSKTISIEIKDPFITTGSSLTHYFGAGANNNGVVTFPYVEKRLEDGTVVYEPELAITEIGQFAFSNFDYIDKGPDDEISEEEPDYTKIWYIGNKDIKEVIIPEGIKTIGPYAFANLTALTRVVLPSTLERIDYGAFYGCSSLTTIVTRDESGQEVEGLIHAKFINRAAFAGTDLRGEITFDRAVAIADEAFAYNESITKLILSDATQSIGAYAFYGNTALMSVDSSAVKLKLGQYVFANCAKLSSISINAAVIPTGAFDGCRALSSIVLGPDVAVIGEYAFRDTRINAFTVAEGNSTYYAQDSKSYLLDASGTKLLFVAPYVDGSLVINDSNITTIAHGAFSGNGKITSVTIPSVTVLENYAFAACTRLQSVNLGNLTQIGDYAFYGTALSELPSLDSLSYIGKYAFAMSDIKTVVIPNGMTIGEGAFRECKLLTSVQIGNNVTIGKNAFRLDRETNFFAGSSTMEPPYYELEDGTKIYYYIYTSELHSLTIGNDVTIGDGAFYGAAELKRVALGERAVIGNAAFYNACSLEQIDLSKVISIGNSAFSGDILYDFADSGYTTPAFDEEGYYIYRFFAPALKSVDLSSLVSLGDDAFAYCKSLQSVVLGDGLTVIPARAFNTCEALTTINLSSVERIETNAFAEAGLLEIDLSSASYIGSYAFVYNEALTKVILGSEAIVLDEGAFAYCSVLNNVVNMKNVQSVGDYAFAITALTEANLSAAEYIGEMAFMKEAMTPFNVTLGDALANIGDNPFAYCLLDAFSANVTETINGKDYTKKIYTFDLSDSIRVIDGILYRVVPNGLELISFAGDAATVNVADNTVRIGAMAFTGYDLEKVVFPYTVASIGHKAFYGCSKLAIVSFGSYNAPILEEEYDPAYYMSGQNLPATGDYSFDTVSGPVTYEGLGIIPYFMWNVSDLPTNIFYGANFIDYIGHIDAPIMMLRPVNGQNYDSFIYGQYFNLVLDGASAADDTTLHAIAAINRLPDKVALSDEALVILAREAYNKVAGMEQLALVTNFEKLENAEKRIANLKFLAGEGSGSGENEQPEKPNRPGASENTADPAKEKNVPVALIIVVLAVAATAVVALVFIEKAKRSKE